MSDAGNRDEQKTDPAPPPLTLQDVMDAVMSMSRNIAELMPLRTLPEAIHQLGSTMLEQYGRATKRDDEQDRRIEELERRLDQRESAGQSNGATQ